MAGGYRRERLEDRLREEVSELVAGELRDPRIGLATITRVELSPDFRRARVLVSVEGDGEAERATLEGLASAASYVRREVSRRLRLRRSPEVVFELDRGPREAMRLEALLQKLKQEA